MPESDHMERTRERWKSEYPGIETDISTRWLEGTPHHWRSIELMRFLSFFDFHFVQDYFGWKLGGDGDNGETLMYEMDVFFEAQDR
jgi:hypothetical protein